MAAGRARCSAHQREPDPGGGAPLHHQCGHFPAITGHVDSLRHAKARHRICPLQMSRSNIRHSDAAYRQSGPDFTIESTEGQRIRVRTTDKCGNERLSFRASLPAGNARNPSRPAAHTAIQPQAGPESDSVVSVLSVVYPNVRERRRVQPETWVPVWTEDIGNTSGPPLRPPVGGAPFPLSGRGMPARRRRPSRRGSMGHGGVLRSRFPSSQSVRDSLLCSESQAVLDGCAMRGQAWISPQRAQRVLLVLPNQPPRTIVISSLPTGRQAKREIPHDQRHTPRSSRRPDPIPTLCARRRI